MLNYNTHVLTYKGAKVVLIKGYLSIFKYTTNLPRTELNKDRLCFRTRSYIEFGKSLENWHSLTRKV